MLAEAVWESGTDRPAANRPTFASWKVRAMVDSHECSAIVSRSTPRRFMPEERRPTAFTMGAVEACNRQPVPHGDVRFMPLPGEADVAILRVHGLIGAAYRAFLGSD